MNALMIKGLLFAAILIGATIYVVNSMNIDLSDPINAITMIGAIACLLYTSPSPRDS